MNGRMSNFNTQTEKKSMKVVDLLKSEYTKLSEVVHQFMETAPRKLAHVSEQAGVGFSKMAAGLSSERARA